MKYITIPIWVTTDLGLSGNEAILYSLIYNATYDGKEYYGSIEHISKVLGVTRKTAINVRDRLVDCELIHKRLLQEGKEKKHCYYRVNLEKIKDINKDSNIPFPVISGKRTNSEKYNQFLQNKYDYDELEKEIVIN